MIGAAGLSGRGVPPVLPLDPAPADPPDITVGAVWPMAVLG